MKTEAEFKFAPFWIIILTLLTFYFIYSGFNTIISPLISWENFLRCLLPILLSFLFLPMTFKLIFNIPAIVLTNDCLKNNFGGYSIEWGDIADIQLYNGGYRSFAKLIINLKYPEKVFNSPLKKIAYKFKQLFVVNDISISLDFVAGNNEEVFEVIKSYWTRKFEH